ncbi:TonB-dependent receptor [bacterium]|nr:TonB-dependent receptor [bacterium]
MESVPTVVIGADEPLSSPLNPYSTYKKESVSGEKFNQANRQSLADLVKDQVGVEAQTYCSNCGAKRLTINGLKGEHTSILIDGLPLHSAVSSFYGVDSIPVNGIDQIDVMRGSGASMTNPEAIGGTLDLITVNPLVANQIYSTSLSVNDSINSSAQNHSALVSIPSETKRFGLTFGGQYTSAETWDEDKNGIAESPERTNYSGILKIRFLPDQKNDISVRGGVSELTILGGAANPSKPSQIRTNPAQETDFENGDVRNRYIGDPSKITDWISLKRYEGALHWTSYVSETATLSWNSGYARQEQRSIYQHGFDYSHNDNIFVTDLSLQWLAGKDHIFNFGLFHKTQRLRSESEKLFVQQGLPKDNFDNTSYASYFKYSFLYSDDLEMDFALRADQIDIDWIQLTNKISQFVVAPRYQIRHNFTDHLSQRFSYGLGYRAPLTFFESQHGNNESGYKIGITELEKAHSLVYSLSYNTPDYYVTGGVHYTSLENMAYGFETESQTPGERGAISYQNSSESYDIWAKDLLLGYKITPWWMLEGSLEFFSYERSYARKLPTAAIEKRFQLKSNMEWGPWTHNLTATFVGSRDLSKYGGYNNYYSDRNQFPSPESRGTFLKRQKAPAHVVLDTSVTYEFWKSYSATFGVSNLLDETQVKHGDSPSAWHWHVDHAHYDGLHTWGPNRGREFLFKLSASF